MDFLKLVRARYSVRQYQNRPVEPEKVEQLLFRNRTDGAHRP